MLPKSGPGGTGTPADTDPRNGTGNERACARYHPGAPPASPACPVWAAPGPPLPGRPPAPCSPVTSFAYAFPPQRIFLPAGPGGAGTLCLGRPSPVPSNRGFTVARPVLPTPGAAGGRACTLDTPNPAADPAAGASPGKRPWGGTRLLQTPGIGKVGPPPSTAGVGGAEVFWFPDTVLIKNSLRGDRRSSMNISGLFKTTKWVFGGGYTGRHSPRCPARPQFTAAGRRGRVGHLRPLGAGAVLARLHPGAHSRPIARCETAPGIRGAEIDRRWELPAPGPPPQPETASALPTLPGAASWGSEGTNLPQLPHPGTVPGPPGGGQQWDLITTRDVPSVASRTISSHPLRAADDRALLPHGSGEGDGPSPDQPIRLFPTKGAP